MKIVLKFSPGDICEYHGLIEDAHLNGRRVTVISRNYVPGFGDYVVDEGDGKPSFARAKNLRLLPPDSGSLVP